MERVILTLMIIMVLMGMVSVPFQYNIVQKLKKEDINASMFFFLPSDLKKYKQFINSEHSKSIRDQMSLNFYGLIITSITTLTCFLFAVLLIFI